MRILAVLMVCCVMMVLWGCGESWIVSKPEVRSSQQQLTTEVACATCIYKMEGVSGCKLAAKIDAKPMLVTGVKVDTHDLGLCEETKQAVLVGRLEGEGFVASKVDIR